MTSVCGQSAADFPRAHSGGLHGHRHPVDTGVPEWFASAIASAPEHLDVLVDGGRIHFRCWGERDRPGLALVHGGGAHSGWWDHIAPHFAATHRVVAPDLSGHGDSDFCDAYDLATFAREVLAVAEASGASGPTTVVGHSMGGWIAAAASASRDAIDGIVIIDTPLRQRATSESRLGKRRPAEHGYATRDEIMARFSTVPAQDVVLPYVAEHIASESVKQIDSGWVWKFDPAVFNAPLLPQELSGLAPLEAMLSRSTCQWGYLHCAHGVVAAPMATQIQRMLSGSGVFVELAAAGHHPMLDQPLALIAVLRTVLQYRGIASSAAQNDGRRGCTN